MKKPFFTLILFLLALCSFNAANNQAVATASNSSNIVNVKPSEDEVFKNKINDLINKRRKISMAIYQTRVDLIKSDPNLRVLHQAIVNLHEKMAKELNDDPRIIAQVDKAREVDKQIAQTVEDYQAKKNGDGGKR